MDLVLSFLMVKTSLKMMMMVVHNKGNPIITAFVVNAKVYILSILLETYFYSSLAKMEKIGKRRRRGWNSTTVDCFCLRLQSCLLFQQQRNTSFVSQKIEQCYSSRESKVTQNLFFLLGLNENSREANVS